MTGSESYPFFCVDKSKNGSCNRLKIKKMSRAI